jgi:hypothetical protein
MHTHVMSFARRRRAVMVARRKSLRREQSTVQ